MTIQELTKLISDAGLLIVIDAIAIIGVLYYFKQIEPRLKKIEENILLVNSHIDSYENVVQNNSIAMTKVSESLNVLAKQVETTNKIYQKIWELESNKGDD